ncbi:MAG: hypothetical protein WBD22_06040 [Pyrinomonadaceae bacterium]
MFEKSDRSARCADGGDVVSEGAFARLTSHRPGLLAAVVMVFVALGAFGAGMRYRLDAFDILGL